MSFRILANKLCLTLNHLNQICKILSDSFFRLVLILFIFSLFTVLGQSNDFVDKCSKRAQKHSIFRSKSGEEICGKIHAKHKSVLLSVGDETVTRGAWPWLVAVYLNKNQGPSFRCGGNLISAKTVVTAASCFRTAERIYTAQDVILILGRHNIVNLMETGMKASQVEQLVIHSDYMSKDNSFDADIAIAILQERVEFTEYIRPICLWEGSDSLSNILGQFGTVIGWGKDGHGNIVARTPMRIRSQVVSEADCLRSSDTFRYITSKRTFCAGSRDGRGPCNGDSGDGMAFQINDKWFLRGIVSGILSDPITNSCNLAEYVVYTDAAKFISWIKLHMR